MNDWKAWQARSKKDMDRAVDAFAKKDYEHAAYMTQQALEKHVKSVWIIGGGEPKELNHGIVERIVEEIQKNIKEGKFYSSILPKKAAEKLALDLCEVMGDMQEHYTTQVATWKHSIGIETTGASGRFGRHVKAAQKFLNGNGGLENQIHKIQKIAQSKVNSYAQKPASSVTQAQIKTDALLAIAYVTEVIIKTLPHETYGRYPTYIEPENEISTSIYVKQFRKLDKLMKETKQACAYLSCVAENLARARKG